MRRGKGGEAVVVPVGPGQIREATRGHLALHLVRVTDLSEDVAVDIEGRTHPRMAEDAADPDDVEAEVDDQVARERGPEVVEAQPRPGAVVESCQLGRTVQCASLDVAAAAYLTILPAGVITYQKPPFRFNPCPVALPGPVSAT